MPCDMADDMADDKALAATGKATAQVHRLR
jgi:hypothetical protein